MERNYETNTNVRSRGYNSGRDEEQMIRPIKKEDGEKGVLTPKPEWVEAFLILLLRRGCRCLSCTQRDPPLSMDTTLTVKVEDLEKFEKLKSNNRTSISFDAENQTVTIKAPEIKLPKKIVVPKKKIFKGFN